MDSLRIVLIIIASLVIIALLIHGFWINKKERSSLFGTVNKSKKNNKNDSILSWQEPQPQDNGFLDDVSEVRVVSSNKIVERNATHLNAGSESSSEIDPESGLVLKKSPVQQDLFSQVNEPLEKKNLDSDNCIEEANIEKSEVSPVPITDDTAVSQQTDVLILHVSGLNGGQLRGDLLLNSIIQSGFQFGEMHIFHRHLDPAGNGPVLFSLANMLKPGTLDIENMPDAMLSGISMFMMIPSYGNGQQNFRLMLQTAQRIADDVNGMVLDDEHHMITPQKIDSYKRRIKQVSNE